MRPLAAATAIAITGTVLLTLLMAVNGGLIPWQAPGFAEYDHHAYLAIARDGPGAPGKASAPPFCWRILTPVIAGALPLDTHHAFLLLSIGSVAGCSLLIWILLRGQGLPPSWCLLGQAVYFSCFWATGFNLWNYLMVDAPALMILTAGLVLLESRQGAGRRRGIWLMVVLAVGALAKESILALAAAVLVHGWRQPAATSTRRLGRALLPILPALGVLLVLRLAITPDLAQMREFAGYSLPSVFLAMIEARLADLPRWFAEAVLDPWGPMILVPVLLAPVATLRWFRRHPHRAILLAVAFAQTLFATSVGRLVMVGLPVLILLSIELLRDRTAGGPVAIPVVGLLMLQFLFQYVRRTTMGLAVPPYEPHPWVTIAYAVRVGSLALFLLLWWTTGRRASQREALV